MNEKIIIFLGGQFQTPIKGVEQYLPEYLSKYTTVYCFEYPRFKKLFELILKKSPLFSKHSSHLIIYHSFGILPCWRQIGFINELNHKINYELFSHFIRKKKDKQIKLISFTPEASFVIERKNLSNIIYYVIDDYLSLPFWSNRFQRKHFLNLEKKMIYLSNSIITVSTWLLNKYQNLHKNVLYYPTPAHLEEYQKKIKKLDEVNPLLKKIRKPIAGFMGSIYDWKIDFMLLLKVMRRLPNISFVFIGKIEITDRSIRKELFSFSNFYYLGYVRESDLPSYVSYFDVGIIPYKINRFGKAAFPVKINEFLSLGKPVITTGIPTIKPLQEKGLIYWAKNTKEFIRLLKRALHEKKSFHLQKARMKYGLSNSWEKRMKQLIHIIFPAFCYGKKR